MSPLKEDSLDKLRLWFEDRSNRKSEAYPRIADELMLITLYKGQLHNHPLRESHKFYLEQTRPQVPDIMYKLFGGEPPKETAEQVEIREQHFQEWKSELKAMAEPDGRIKEAYIDFENDRFFCPQDVDLMGRINDSLEFCFELIQKCRV